MTEAKIRAANGETLQLRLVHRSAQDPLFEAASYTYSVETSETGFEVTVRFAPIFVHLLPMNSRSRLAALSEQVVRTAIEAGVRGPATVRVSSDGTPRLGELCLEPLLPLRLPA